MDEIALSLKHITKRYPGVTALNDVSFDIKKGEVHAIIGENGAGKSTLIKIIAGAIETDEGTICLNGTVYNKITPRLSKKLGTEVIYQERNLIDSLSVSENICFGDRTGKLVSYKKMIEKASEILKQFNIQLDMKKLVKHLSPAEQQIVEIAKAIKKDVKILIMDEPTAPLTVEEVELLFEIIERLKKLGITIIYISHRLDEVFKITDRITILRDGMYVDTKKTGDTNRQELINLMVGRALKETYPRNEVELSDVAFEAKKITGNRVNNISFYVKKGEILGIAGLLGAGRTELVRMISGADKKEKGEILIDGRLVSINSPKQAIKLGIGLIPEDRKVQGCFLSMDIKWNISISNIKKLMKNGIVDFQRENMQAQYYKDLLRIKTPSLRQKVNNLSGGNQQKVVLSKVLAADSKIIIFDEPTKGIDVGAREEIYNLMCSLTKQGKTIIMISSDMEELLGMSDRIIVLCEGRLTGEVLRSEFKQNLILELASNNIEGEAVNL
jgi:ABC-type sugar transport system, ATPase component